MLTRDTLKAQARTLGFDLCGIAPVAAYPELGFLAEWVAHGYAGEMHYMARTADRRADVRALLPSARSVIMTATVYNTDRPYSTESTDPGQARIARYAWGDDYHQILTRRLEALLAWMRAQSPDPFDARLYVDTGPVQERVYGQYAGLGWIGKNTCLINPQLGSWLALGEIICSVPFAADAPALDQCGTCQLCLEACPTQAFAGPWTLDATRCLSYLTIESKGDVPEHLREALGSHVFGCDICQEVCPWNGDAARSDAEEWQPRAALDRPRLTALWRQSDDALRRALKGSAMKRAGVRRLRRNVAVALGNTDDPEAAAALATAGSIGDSTDTRADPSVTAHRSWALRRLSERARPVRASPPPDGRDP